MFGLRELLMGAITLAAMGLVAGCGGDGGAGQPTTAASSTGAPAPASAGTQLYDGQAFAIAYPGGWWVHNAEQPKRFGTATTILDPSNHARAIRIDVRAHATPARAVPTIHRLHGRPGYQELDLSPVSFEGHDALHWEFVVDQGGRSVHKEALFFEDQGGRGVTIVTQAPAAQYGAWSKYFAATRRSYLPY
jgi:hypothetical protein